MFIDLNFQHCLNRDVLSQLLRWRIRNVLHLSFVDPLKIVKFVRVSLERGLLSLERLTLMNKTHMGTVLHCSSEISSVLTLSLINNSFRFL